MPSISSSKPEAPLAGSITTKATASTSIGCARPPFTRSAAFFFACCSAKRSSSATHAASCSSADLLLGIVEWDMVVALGGDRGVAQWLCHLGCVDCGSRGTISNARAIRCEANKSEPTEESHMKLCRVMKVRRVERRERATPPIYLAKKFSGINSRLKATVPLRLRLRRQDQTSKDPATLLPGWRRPSNTRVIPQA